MERVEFGHHRLKFRPLDNLNLDDDRSDRTGVASVGERVGAKKQKVRALADFDRTEVSRDAKPTGRLARSGCEGLSRRPNLHKG